MLPARRLHRPFTFFTVLVRRHIEVEVSHDLAAALQNLELLLPLVLLLLQTLRLVRPRAVQVLDGDASAAYLLESLTLRTLIIAL